MASDELQVHGYHLPLQPVRADGCAQGVLQALKRFSNPKTCSLPWL
ncbi:MAG: hypothetical protein ACRECD_10420 [Burkholderiaceae bacterium]